MMDRSTWGSGPWDDEPDRLEWKDALTGYPCLAKRNPAGAWCGYVALPPGHPQHGASYFAVDATVHGGLTYGDYCAGEICHVPAPGEPDDVFWLGFDCAHADDLVPSRPGPHDTYRDLAFVKCEVTKLAAQLAALSV